MSRVNPGIIRMVRLFGKCYECQAMGMELPDNRP